MFKVQNKWGKHAKQFYTNSGQAEEKEGVYSGRYVMKLRTIVGFPKILVKI